MKCQLYERVLLLDTETLAPADACALEAHAAGCGECTEALAAVRSARAIARTHQVAAPPASRVRIWRAVEVSAKQPEAPPSLLKLATLAAVLLLALAIVKRALEPAEEAEPAQTQIARHEPAQEAPSALLPGVTIHEGEGARFSVRKTDLAVTEVLLESGDLEVITTDPSITVDVITPEMRVQVIGSQVTLHRRADATEVAVVKGSASVWARRTPLPLRLQKGQHTEVRVESTPAVAVRSDRPAVKSAPIVTVNNQAVAETLREARRSLVSDAPHAAELAEKVLDAAAPKTELEAEALAVLADAERRRGRLVEAAVLYDKVSEHQHGSAFAEEAMLQRAMILARIDKPESVLAELKRAEVRFPNGPTAPERAALSAEAHLARKDANAAADAIERASAVGRSALLLERRLDVARALHLSNPERARAILEPVLDERAPIGLRTAAQALIEKMKIRERHGN